MIPLLKSATQLEAQPLLDAVTVLESYEFPVGQLQKVTYQDVTFLLAHFGVGKVNTAAGLAVALERFKPSYVLQFGIGGAFVGSYLSNGMLAVAADETHVDTGVRTQDGWSGMQDMGFGLLQRGEQVFYNVFPVDAALSQRLCDLTGAISVRFATSETVTGSFDDAALLQERFDVAIESMEGAAAAQTCAAFGVAFAEIRGVSNIVGERQKHAWNIPGAVREVNNAIMRFVVNSAA